MWTIDGLLRHWYMVTTQRGADIHVWDGKDFTPYLAKGRVYLNKRSAAAAAGRVTDNMRLTDVRVLNVKEVLEEANSGQERTAEAGPGDSEAEA